MEFVYYVYAYVRNRDNDTGKAGTPYYIGKGKDRRMFSKARSVDVLVPLDRRYIVVLESNLSELGAFALERRYIEWYGRIDNGDGILQNKAAGGDGNFDPSKKTRLLMSSVKLGKTLSEEHKKNISRGMKGRIVTNETRKRIGDANRGKRRLRKLERNYEKVILGLNRPKKLVRN